MLQFMSSPDIRERHRAYLRRVVDETNTPPTTLARRVGVAPSTLTRALNDPHHATALRASTLEALERFSGIPFSDAPIRAMREPEAVPYDAAQTPRELREQVGTLATASNSVTIWTLRSRALEGLGYLPGDILIVDLNAEARRGDIVCAQIYDWPRMKAETVFRLCEPPYLVAATSERELLAPRLIDKNVGLKGPVLLSVRGRPG
jgi:SOS-response transcriptional repressor LexA